MKNQTKLRTGLVGCGWHGTALAEALSRCDALQLVACADIDEIAASRAASLSQDVSTHASIEAMLDECDVDAIVIATPHHLLAPITLAAINAGKHVMIEKPIALNDYEASEIERAVEKAGITYMAGYSFRFSMGRYVRDLLGEEIIGDILAINSSISVGPMNDGWIANPDTGGGALLYVGCHIVDWILWFLNEMPAQVFGTVNERADTRADGTSAFQMSFSKNVLAQCLVTQRASTLFYEIDIHGTRGKISLRGRNFLQFEIEVSSQVAERYHEPTIIRPSVKRDNIQMMLVPELDEFASAIHENRSPAITIADGRKVLQILDAVKESSRCNHAVKMASSI